jgi:repressor LexA
MTQPVFLIPKRTRATWTPALEPLDLAEEPGVELPLLGYVSAGRPVETPEDNEVVTVPSHMARKASYALRVRGHSMTDDQIQDGDIIIVEQRQTAENGETVVALINGEKVTLKRFYVERDGIFTAAWESDGPESETSLNSAEDPVHGECAQAWSRGTPGLLAGHEHRVRKSTLGAKYVFETEQVRRSRGIGNSVRRVGCRDQTALFG